MSERKAHKPRLPGLFVIHFGLFLLLPHIVSRTVRKNDYRFWWFTRSTFLGFLRVDTPFTTMTNENMPFETATSR